MPWRKLYIKLISGTDEGSSSSDDDEGDEMNIIHPHQPLSPIRSPPRSLPQRRDQSPPPPPASRKKTALDKAPASSKRRKLMSGSVTSRMKDPAGEDKEVSEAAKKAMLKSLKQAKYVIPTPSDYERQINNKRNKELSREKVNKEKMKEKELAAADIGLTEEELQAIQTGDDDKVEFAPLAFKYVHGKDLLEGGKKVIDKLPTRMRELHKWYKEQAKKGCKQFGFILPADIFHDTQERITWVEFAALFCLFQAQNLDLRILTLWTM